MELLISSVIVKPDRQRRLFDEEEIKSLAHSIQKLGQLQPIVVTRDHTLMCGERRLRACSLLGKTTIEATYFESLDTTHQELAQLDENVKRENLTWQENAQAYQRIHLLLKQTNESWNVEKTAEYVGLSTQTVYKYIDAAQMLKAHPDKVSHCTQLSQVVGVAERMRNRAVEKELASVQTAQQTSLETLFADPALPAPAPVKLERSLDNTIICEDFAKWAEEYEGEPFNFLHCDFPYGINHQKSEQGGSDDWGAYEDTPEIYWNLCAVLGKNWDRLVAPSAHIMFWFSLTFYEKTISFFEQLGSDIRVNPFPVIWVKSDGSGILPDPRRGPRRTYETALIVSRGDRFVVRSIANHYAAPATKKLHISEKPQPVLRHFLRLFIDETSTVLDPTCGSGNALAVADELKAKKIQGVELNPDYADFARSTLKRARAYGRLDDVNLEL